MKRIICPENLYLDGCYFVKIVLPNVWLAEDMYAAMMLQILPFQTKSCCFKIIVKRDEVFLIGQWIACTKGTVIIARERNLVAVTPKEEREKK